MTASRRRARLALVALGASAAVAVVAAPAQAVHWPFFGGDNGRSGYQPIDEGEMPAPFLYSKTVASSANDAFIKTSIVTTTGPPTTAATAARLIYGNRDGFVHFQRLLDGAPIGPEAGTNIDGGPTVDLDVFGTRSVAPGGNGSSVSFVDTSGATGLGQLYAVHNDTGEGAPADPDIEVAQFNETTGALVGQVDVAGTDGFTIESSPVATGAAADGTRALFFVAGNGGTQALFRVPVAADGTVQGATATRTAGDNNATPLASPTLVSIPNAMGAPVAHIAVGTTDAIVKTYPAADVNPVTPGPVSAPLGGDVQTPSVPIQPTGLTPSAGQPVPTAPFIYVAAATTGGTTTVRKLTVTAAALATTQSSAPLAGTPAPALATDQESEPVIGEAKVFVTTGENLYFLSTQNLNPAGTFSQTALVPGTTGFQQTTAAGNGDFVYVTNDQAEQFVLRLSDAQTVAPAPGGFTPNVAAVATPGTGVGQPSISRGFIQFSGGTGAFVHRTTDVTGPSVALTAPADNAAVTGSQTFAATASDTRGIASVQFRLNGQVIGTDTALDSGSPFAPGAGAAYSASFNTATVPNGFYVVDAVATDSSGVTTTSAARRITINNGAAAPGNVDDRPPTVTFTAPAANALVRSPATVSANATDDKGIASVRFSVGDRVVCTDTTAPYSCAAAFTGADVGRNSLFAVATDTAGQTGSAVRVVRVDRFTPKRVSAKVSPTRDRRAPYRFRTSGTVSLPTGVTRAQACGDGVVSVQVKRGSTTLSTRRVTLSRTCTYSSTVSFANRRRLGSSGRLKITARFLGNDVLKRRDAASRSVRAG